MRISVEPFEGTFEGRRGEIGREVLEEDSPEEGEACSYFGGEGGPSTSAYIDTNIYDYVALKHPAYGEACKNIVRDIYEGKLETYGSILVAVEILGPLMEIDADMAVGAVKAFLSLPVKIIPMDESTIQSAVTGASYDAVHASAMARKGISTVITEDLGHWKMIQSNWSRVRDKISTTLGEIEIVRPKEYVKWEGRG